MRSVLFLRGSVVQLRRKCGRKGCRCSEGELHETWALAYSTAGKVRMVMLREEDLPKVRAAVERYGRAQEALQARAELGIERLRGMVAREVAAGRRGRGRRRP